MTDPSVGAQPPFGVGQVVGESFSLLFKRFFVFFILSFVPAIISSLTTTAYFGTEYFSGQSSPAVVTEMTEPIGLIMVIVLPIVIYGLSTALIVCAAYDAKLGRAARIGQYFDLAPDYRTMC